MQGSLRLLLAAALVLSWNSLRAEDADQKKKGPETAADVPAGHSYHGEAFNEGPRQKAYLMGGTGDVSFPATVSKPIVQKFINQGLGQLHGFWYLEAERSFRQAAAIDPECAIAYWGMAMANASNAKRSKGFIALAVKRKSKVTERERLYIEALDTFIQAGSKKEKDRSQKYAKALERISYKFPDDIEAKALLGLQMWVNRRRGIPINSHLAVSALLEQVIAKNPLHPCHHYRIHLWDYERPENALNSAARCGQAAASIAHMWHMPGHIYSRLKRYEDACFQQEASARVDHAHMIRDRVLPDQIHNFAHNNEWLIRNLIHVGRVGDALSLARNMIELPRHPRYNTLKRYGSLRYGRMRLFQVLSTYELWDDLISLSATSYLEPTDKFDEQIKRQRYLGRAYFGKGQADKGRELLALLEKQLAGEKMAQDKAGAAARAKLEAPAKKAPVKKAPAKKAPVKKVPAKKAADDKAEGKPAAEKSDAKKSKAKKTDAKNNKNKTAKKPDKKAIKKAVDAARKPFAAKVRTLERAVQELQGHVALTEKSEKKAKEALDLFKKAGGIDSSFLAFVQLAAGDGKAAEKALRDHAARRVGEVQPRARLVELLWRRGKKKEAEKEIKDLRKMSGSIDITSPVFARLAPVAKEADLPENWRIDQVVRADTGKRPRLDDLGPFRWRPMPAPAWKLPGHGDKTVNLKDYRGRPVMVIFYLGYGCLHCVEQLQAFAPKTDAFRKAGIELVAISSDTQQDLIKSMEKYKADGKFPFPIAADPKLKVFKKFRCYDDFENLTLHGTFLIDGDGLIRWQDISYEPFMDVEFALKEAKRLLAQSPTKQVVRNSR